MKSLLLCVFLMAGNVFAANEKTDEIETTSPVKIDREGIRKVFLDKQKDLQTCYETDLAKAKDKKAFAGKLVLDFTIDEDGSVMYMAMDPTRSTLKSHSLAGCLVKKAYTWTFPKPPAKQTVQVYYPMSFSGK